MRPNDLETRLLGRMMLGLAGPVLDERIEGLLRRGLGGIALFARNIEDPQQMWRLVNSARKIGGERLLVAIDQEGGRVQRLPEPFTRWPSARTVAARCRVENRSEPARRMGASFGEELRAVGVDINFAPVVDIATNPLNSVIADRAWGKNPERVVELAGAFLAGLQSAGVWGCLKHFPGHGDTLLDSHHSLPEVMHSLETLEGRELVPYRLLRAAAPLVMSAHLRAAEVDELPVTLSWRWLGMVLRRRLGYRGMIITDDLSMGAITSSWTSAEACVESWKAGADLLLVCDPGFDPDPALEAMAGLLETPKRLEESEGWERSMRNRFRRGPWSSTSPPAGGWPEHRAWVEELAPAGA